jgi:hypothetical protein
MRTNIKWLLGLLLVGLVLPLFYYYITNERPNVRFEISQGIPTNFVTSVSDQSSYCIQEINIKNYGNKKAENIILKVADNIIDYDIQKNVEHDIVEIKRGNRSFELQYAELVPDGKFRLILKTIAPVGSTYIKMFDSTGQCKQIERVSVGLFVENLFWNIWLVFIFAILLTGLLYYKDEWKTMIRFADLDRLFHKRKPFWVNKLDWNQKLKDAFSYKIENDWSQHDLKETVSYKIIDYDIRELKTEKAVLRDILSMASKRLAALLLDCKLYYYQNKIQTLLSLRMPRNFDKERWGDIQNDLQKKYVAYLKEEILDYSSIEKWENEISKIATYSLSKAMRDEYEDFLKKNYMRELININIFNEGSIHESLKKTRYKDILSQDEQEKIESLTYKIQLISLEHTLEYDKSSRKKLEKNEYAWLKRDDADRLKKKIYGMKLEDVKLKTADELKVSIESAICGTSIGLLVYSSFLSKSQPC